MPTLFSSAGLSVRGPSPAAVAAALLLGASLAPSAGVCAAEPTRELATQPGGNAGDDTRKAAAHLIETLGLRVAPQPVRERPGWRPPRVVLIGNGKEMHELLPQLQQAAPGARLVEISAATPRDIAEADAAIGVCSPEVLAKARHLQWIQWGAAGVERCVQQPLIRERRPLITNTQRTAAPSMAEHVLALMLALSRHLPLYLHEQQQRHWAGWDEVPASADLEGHTLLVVGLGGIGTEVASRAHALGMRVVATRASGRTGPDYVSYVGLPDELLKLTRDADFVVNCAPLTPQTTAIFNQQFFATMKRSAYFINVGRGRSAVTADLVAALDSGRIAGAGLDVVDPEPLPADAPLWRAPNLIITPHISADTPASLANYSLLLRENLRRYVAGEPMLSVVDIERGY
jgi:phosphoglycerate dehydrogenase-like enzyme